MGVFCRVYFMLSPINSVYNSLIRSSDLVIVHGIWNLSRSQHELRLAIREAGRISVCETAYTRLCIRIICLFFMISLSVQRLGAGLFVFTFSRATLPADALPESDEPYIFRQFNGDRCCFMTETQLLSELATVGFTV